MTEKLYRRKVYFELDGQVYRVNALSFTKNLDNKLNAYVLDDNTSILGMKYQKMEKVDSID